MPPEMSDITRGIARNLSCAIRQRERERERKGRDTEWIVPQQTDGPFSLIFLSYSYRRTKERREKNALLFLSRPFLILSFLLPPSPFLLHFFLSFCPSVFTRHFLKILLTLARLPLSPFLSIVPWRFNSLFLSSSTTISSVFGSLEPC